MRDKDANTAWAAASDATLEERRCWWQNAGGGRADVGVLAPGAGQLSVTRGNRIGYAGYRFDPATERYQGRHRVYAPEVGRWTRREPLGYVDGDGLLRKVDCTTVILT